ncbi:MAG: secondary thiamine-phosphate synthase enzyme YjbQ [Candidatus Omnitrophica bacterium]|nr:secondary thiamine-phosphate synthase enzyme YjbQ [Candidatus Omnitrophota bacterium]
MSVVTRYIKLSTQGNAEITDITPRVAEELSASGLRAGIVNISVCGSTGALTTCEYEPGLVQDIKDIFNKLIPPGEYHHDQTWHDGNGHSHLRASLVGPSLALPFIDGALALGTWQQIIFIDFDNRSRSRKLIVQIVGE